MSETTGPHYRCLVCGYPGLDEPPRTEESGASYEICPSCGFEFGVTDEDRGISYEQWRREWIAGGMRWWSRRRPPAGWDPQAQVRELGDPGPLWRRLLVQQAPEYGAGRAAQARLLDRRRERGGQVARRLRALPGGPFPGWLAGAVAGIPRDALDLVGLQVAGCWIPSVRVQRGGP